jgi:ankyrin repeat protein
VAEYLLGRGADVNWVGWDGLTPLDAAQRSNADELVRWLRSIGGTTARESVLGGRSGRDDSIGE